jgi:hypothetical protein
LIAINRKWRESYPVRIPIRWLQTTRSAAPAIPQNADLVVVGRKVLGEGLFASVFRDNGYDSAALLTSSAGSWNCASKDNG